MRGFGDSLSCRDRAWIGRNDRPRRCASRTSTNPQRDPESRLRRADDVAASGSRPQRVPFGRLVT